MAKPKKENRIGLVVMLIIPTIVILIVEYFLLSSEPWTWDSDYGFSRDEKTMTIDDNFIDKVKDHKYQTLKETKNYNLMNSIDQNYKKTDGKLKLKVPTDWLEDEYGSDEYRLVFSPEDKKTGNISQPNFTFETKPGEKINSRNEEEIFSIEDILEERIKFYTDSENNDAVVVDKYRKKINGVQYQMAVIKEDLISSIDYPFYRFLYVRELDEGPLKRSFLSAEAEFITPKTKDQKEILDTLYTFENVLGGFDESKAEVKKASDEGD